MYVKGSAFLWHQIRCIMAILFLIGEEKEDVTLIDILLKENSYHYNYAIASEETLILSNCQFEGVKFQLYSNEDKDSNSCFYNFSQLCELYEKTILESTLKQYMLEEYSNLLIANTIKSNCKIENNYEAPQNDKLDKFNCCDNKDNLELEYNIIKAINQYKTDFPDLKMPMKYTRLLSRKRDNKMIYKTIENQKENNKIYLQGISPEFSRQILIDNVADYNNFLTLTNLDGKPWEIKVVLKLEYRPNETLTFNITVNPRQNDKLNAPSLN